MLAQAKERLVPKPNTATTTIAPMTTRAPPEDPGAESFIQPGIDQIKESALRWIKPVLIDVGLLSASFAVVGLVVGIGNHIPSYKCGEHPAVVSSRVLKDTVNQWLAGIALLVAAWLLSIVLASELAPTAKRVQASQYQESLYWLAPLLAVLCVLTTGLHAVLLSRTDCRACSGGGGGGCCSRGGSSDENENAQDESLALSVARKICAVISGIMTVLVAILGALLGAAEAPMTACALSSTYKSYLATSWLLPMVPWGLAAEQIAQTIPGLPKQVRDSPGQALVAAGGVVALLFTVLLTVARRWSEDHTDVPEDAYRKLEAEDPQELSSYSAMAKREDDIESQLQEPLVQAMEDVKVHCQKPAAQVALDPLPDEKQPSEKEPSQKASSEKAPSEKQLTEQDAGEAKPLLEAAVDMCDTRSATYVPTSVDAVDRMAQNVVTVISN